MCWNINTGLLSYSLPKLPRGFINLWMKLGCALGFLGASASGGAAHTLYAELWFSVVCQCFPIEYYYYSETWNLNWRSICISQIFSTTGNVWWGCNLQCYCLHSKCVSSLKGRQLLTADAYCPSNSILPPSELWFGQEQEIILPELFCSSSIV